MVELEPCTYVIFGATGHLSRTKLMPALYHLEANDRLPAGSKILCIGRSDWETGNWRDEIKEKISPRVRNGLDETIFKRFRERLIYIRGDLHTDELYQSLIDQLNGKDNIPPNCAFYMSIRPAEFGIVIQKLGESGLLEQQHGWIRAIIEKPFGADL